MIERTNPLRRTILHLAIPILVLAACAPSAPVMPAGHGPIVLPCEEAYRTAVIVHEREHRPSDFDAAIATCATFGEWTTVVAIDPTALDSDAMRFLRERCRQARPLASAVICAPINR